MPALDVVAFEGLQQADKYCKLREDDASVRSNLNSETFYMPTRIAIPARRQYQYSMTFRVICHAQSRCSAHVHRSLSEKALVTNSIKRNGENQHWATRNLPNSPLAGSQAAAAYERKFRCFLLLPLLPHYQSIPHAPPYPSHCHSLPANQRHSPKWRGPLLSVLPDQRSPCWLFLAPRASHRWEARYLFRLDERREKWSCRWRCFPRRCWLCRESLRGKP